MRQVIDKIKWKYNSNNYNIIFNNCQDFVENVRQEYYKIKKGKQLC